MGGGEGSKKCHAVSVVEEINHHIFLASLATDYISNYVISVATALKKQLSALLSRFMV